MSNIKPAAVGNSTQFPHWLSLLAVVGTVGFAGIVHKPQWLEQSLEVEQTVVVQSEATGYSLEMSLCNKTVRVSHLKWLQHNFLPNHEI